MSEAPFIGDRPKHPHFDMMWEKHKGMVYWWDKKLCDWLLYISDHHYPWGYFRGWLTIRFNRALYTWDSTKGSLFNYFSTRIRYGLLINFMQHESETWYRFVRNIEGEQKQLHNETEQNYTFHESGYTLYRVPDKDLDWAEEIISHFDTAQAAFDYFTSPLNVNEKIVITRRYKSRHTLEAIAIDLQLTRERIRQIERKAISKIRRVLAQHEQFVSVMNTIANSAADTRPIRLRELDPVLPKLTAQIHECGAITAIGTPCKVKVFRGHHCINHQ